MLNHLSLFSGYEGFGLGLRLAGVPIRTIGYVEIDEYCQRLLQARIRDGFLDWAPIIRDIRTADFRPMAGMVDIVTTGFPCQPHSVAGKRKGADDERNLWPDTLRAISEVGPGIVLLENVPGILANGYGGTVIGQLSEIGYDCKWGIVSAADAGANHLRKRWWVLAYAKGQRTRLLQACSRTEWVELHRQGWSGVGYQPDNSSQTVAYSQGWQDNGRKRGDLVETLGSWRRINAAIEPGGEDVADAEGAERQCSGSARSRRDGFADGGYGQWWLTEPPLGRVANGVADRVAQLRAAGNGIVPAVVKELWRRIGSDGR